MPRRLISWILLTLMSMHSLYATAHAKTDTVTFYNGDRVTGEIKSLFAGYLSLKTDAMGTINIEWQELARIESRYNYEVRLSNGERHFGSLNQAKRPGALVVTFGTAEEQFDWLEVVELRPVEATWKERIKADVSGLLLHPGHVHSSIRDQS